MLNEIFRWLMRRLSGILVWSAEIASYAADKIGVYWFLRLMKRKKAMILMYHGISGKNITSLMNFDGKHVNIRLFERQLEYLKKHYSIISLDDYFDSRAGKKSLPKNPAILTFDDGYRNNFTEMYPLMKKHRVPVMIFLSAGIIGSKDMTWQNKIALCLDNSKKDRFTIRIKGKMHSYKIGDDRSKVVSFIRIKNLLRYMGRKEKEDLVKEMMDKAGASLPERDDELHYLSWEEARKMARESKGMLTFGSHTMTHPRLSRITGEMLRWEITHSKSSIEKELGLKINHFSYPHGDYNADVLDAMRSSGYESAVTVEYGYNRIDEEPYRLKRIAVSNNNSMPLFMLSLFVNLDRSVKTAAGFYNRLKR